MTTEVNNVEELNFETQGGADYLLIDPIVVGTAEPITKLTFQKPQAKHTKHFPNQPGQIHILTMISKLTGLSSLEVDEISLRDYKKISTLLEPFL